jgi:hypothetical protein
MSFHLEVLSTVQKKVLRQLGPIMTQRGFHLVGGTALAIYFGRRHSVDLDWFTGEHIAEPLRFAQELRGASVSFVTAQIGRGTLHGSVSGVRVSFLEYRYPLLKVSVAWQEFGCLLASLDDLACMKLSAQTWPRPPGSSAFLVRRNEADLMTSIISQKVHILAMMRWG